MIVTIGGLSTKFSASLSCSKIFCKFHCKISSIERPFSSLFTLTPNSSAIKAAVSKSIVHVIQTKILFCINFLITSLAGIPIFSENSLTVIVSGNTTSSFFFNVSETFCSFGFFSIFFSIFCCLVSFFSKYSFFWVFSFL